LDDRKESHGGFERVKAAESRLEDVRRRQAGFCRLGPFPASRLQVRVASYPAAWNNARQNTNEEVPNV
jgi:hypothetical protein